MIYKYNFGQAFSFLCFDDRSIPKLPQLLFQVNGKYVVKSGTDFRQMSQITLTFNENNNSVDVEIEEVSITSDLEEDPEVKAIVTEYMGMLRSRPYS